MTGTGGSAVTDTYTYDAHDKLTGISGGTNKTYGYDSPATARPLPLALPFLTSWHTF